MTSQACRQTVKTFCLTLILFAGALWAVLHYENVASMMMVYVGLAIAGLSMMVLCYSIASLFMGEDSF